jgi:type IV fimbrial biogenesis protein FimT
MISLLVLGILLALGAPSFAEWLQNQQIRAATEATLNGLQLARATAVQRNVPVRFQFVTDLTAGCSLTNSAVNWVVSIADPANACDAAPDTSGLPNPPAPGIIQIHSSAEGTPNVVATPVYVPPPPGGATSATTVTFSALGSVINPNADGSSPIAKIDFTNPRLAVSAARPLRVVITTGGSIRMCDPAVTGTDPRACPAFP